MQDCEAGVGWRSHLPPRLSPSWLLPRLTPRSSYHHRPKGSGHVNMWAYRHVWPYQILVPWSRVISDTSPLAQVCRLPGVVVDDVSIPIPASFYWRPCHLRFEVVPPPITGIRVPGPGLRKRRRDGQEFPCPLGPFAVCRWNNMTGEGRCRVGPGISADTDIAPAAVDASVLERG
jgi:hypothetical protein